jgi:hypothetical protein
LALVAVGVSVAIFLLRSNRCQPKTMPVCGIFVISFLAYTNVYYLSRCAIVSPSVRHSDVPLIQFRSFSPPVGAAWATFRLPGGLGSQAVLKENQ